MEVCSWSARRVSDDARLVRVQPQAHLAHPLGDGGKHILGPSLIDQADKDGLGGSIKKQAHDSEHRPQERISQTGNGNAMGQARKDHQRSHPKDNTTQGPPVSAASQPSTFFMTGSPVLDGST